MIGTEEKVNYFDSFMKEVSRELEKGNTYYVFSKEQLEYIQNKYSNQNLKVELRDDIYYLKLERGV